MFDRLGALGVIKEDQIVNYKQHIENLKHDNDDTNE
jgi:hypothetical protein